MINSETIARIFDTAQIVDVVQDFISLKRRGANLLGLCPFHNEKTPSFTVSPAKNIFKCFGCGKGGNPVHFVMEHENLSYPEALKYLAKRYHIEIVETELSPEEKQQQNERESLLIVSSYAQKFFSKTLKETHEGKAIGLSYFQERGVRDDTIEKFQLGYSPENKSALSDAAFAAGYKIKYLVQTGLTIEKEDFRIDRFASRVIFPIHSISGQVIGFGGRTLRSDKKVAKYLNSPESDIYSKSKVLYGLFFAKKSMVQEDKCYLVEGYTDVISMHQSGIENVVASSGTALTVDQIRLISRFTKNVTILYDGDEAGIKASLRGIDLILEQGLNVRVVMFPAGQDPDSFARERSATELKEYLDKEETDFITFKTKLLANDAKGDPIKRAGLITDIVRTISIIPDPIMRSVFIKECSRYIEVDEKVLQSELNKKRRQKHEQEDRRASYSRSEDSTTVVEPVRKVGTFELEEREIVRLLLLFANNVLFTVDEDEEGQHDITVVEYVIDEIEKDEIVFSVPDYKRIYDGYKNAYENGSPIDSKFFINNEDIELGRVAVDLITTRYRLSKIHEKGGVLVETEEMKLAELIPKAIIELKHRLVIHELRELEKSMQEAQNEGNEETFTSMLGRYMELKTQDILLSKNLGERTIVR